ncbi:MAG: LTA synthase family protein [bacterium]|nr:LTA synthase family protein [bacterium]
MLRVFFFYLGTLFYMETVYHIGALGLSPVNPLLALPLWIFFAGLFTLLSGCFREKGNRAASYVFLTLAYLLFAAQLVYMRIFRRPLLMAAVTDGAKDAVTNYYREALLAILHASGWLLLLAVPFAVAAFLQKKRRWRQRQLFPLDRHTKKERLGNLGILAGGICSFLLVCACGFRVQTNYYENYAGFFDPHGVIASYGVMPAVVRDLCGDIFPESGDSLAAWVDPSDLSDADPGSDAAVVPLGDVALSDGASASSGSPLPSGTDTAEASDPDLAEQNAVSEKTPDTSPNVLPVDFEALIEHADSDQITKLAEYMQSIPATSRNEYTGMFAGYNLIFLTAEGFSPYAVDETLTPTLYRLIHSGFVFNDYYVPLWHTSTSDGEYTNLTGLIPDQQFSMRRSSEIAMPFSLPSFFALEGVHSYAYHNNTLDYYKRHLSHPNLGYRWQASRLGKLDESVWGGQVFEMEHADYWPASDLDMMKATIPEYLQEDRFHVYYMTVSGHMYYTFGGNRMSSLHKEEVADLPYSNEGKAYIACNIELDRALEYLIGELDAAGKLEHTVICLSADHYPYGMEIANLEELAGMPLENTLDLYRNNLILWNSEMETVIVEKPACSMDVLPTLLNLFGFSYDARLYAGRDILSDSAPLVIFSDRSFITDRVRYNKTAGVTEWTDHADPDEEYLNIIRAQVRGLYSYTAGILNHDFYHYVLDALPDEYHPQIDPDWTAPHPPLEKEEPPAAEEHAAPTSENPAAAVHAQSADGASPDDD